MRIGIKFFLREARQGKSEYIHEECERFIMMAPYRQSRIDRKFSIGLFTDDEWDIGVELLRLLLNPRLDRI